jgi:uncharacterized damage-inducible protein DinB
LHRFNVGSVNFARFALRSLRWALLDPDQELLTAKYAKDANDGKKSKPQQEEICMKFIYLVVIITLALPTFAADQKPASTLKTILLEQLRSTHNKAEWFVPANTAVEGLTAEQATWTDGKGNHSVGQLANHLIFWNRQELAKFKGESAEKFSGNNDETFNSFDTKKWNETVKQLDEVLTELEKTVESADEAKLKEWSSDVAHIGTHNAYHIGQIVFVRKEQGSWNPEKGVK